MKALDQIQAWKSDPSAKKRKNLDSIRVYSCTKAHLLVETASFLSIETGSFVCVTSREMRTGRASDRLVIQSTRGSNG